jgi:hypothetical protein
LSGTIGGRRSRRERFALQEGFENILVSLNGLLMFGTLFAATDVLSENHVRA